VPPWIVGSKRPWEQSSTGHRVAYRMTKLLCRTEAVGQAAVYAVWSPTGVRDPLPWRPPFEASSISPSRTVVAAFDLLPSSAVRNHSSAISIGLYASFADFLASIYSNRHPGASSTWQLLALNADHAPCPVDAVSQPSRSSMSWGSAGHPEEVNVFIHWFPPSVQK
jgi:hypothetical protein